MFFGLGFRTGVFEFVDPTLDALEGDVELALLPAADLNLSRGLFCVFY